MKNRFRLVCYRKRGGAYFIHDKETNHREPLGTADKNEAIELLVTKNEADRDRAFNLQKARIYLAAADPAIRTWTWADALDAVIASKPENGETRHR